MKHGLNPGWVVAAAVALAAAPKAAAEDTVKLAVADRGAWDSAAPELGQRAGIFKKHGIALDLLYLADDGVVGLAEPLLGEVRTALSRQRARDRERRFRTDARVEQRVIKIEEEEAYRHRALSFVVCPLRMHEEFPRVAGNTCYAKIPGLRVED